MRRSSITAMRRTAVAASRRKRTSPAPPFSALSTTSSSSSSSTSASVPSGAHSTPVSLRQILAFSADAPLPARVVAAEFLRSECAGRFHRRLADLQRLPFGLASQPGVKELARRFESSRDRFLALPPVTGADEVAALGDAVEASLREHGDTTVLIGAGVGELGRAARAELEIIEQAMLQHEVDQFHVKLLSVRLLMAHHHALACGAQGGIFDHECKVSDVAQEAAAQAARVMGAHFKTLPRVEVEADAHEGTLRHVPDLVRFVFAEVIKNAMMATVRHHPQAAAGGGELPPIRVMCTMSADGRAGAQVSDHGGGFSRHEAVQVWNYLYSGSDPLPGIADDSTVDCFLSRVYERPACGTGDGLPLARLFAQYFGGDLRIHAMEGYGADAFVWLPALDATDTPLPM